MENNISQTLDKGIQVLKFVAESDKPIGVSEASKGLKFSKTATFRFMETLADHRLLHKNEDGKYEVGSQAAYIGSRFRVNEVVKSSLYPIMKKLKNEMGCGVQLCMLIDDRIVVIEYMRSSSIVQIKSDVGTEMTLNTSAAGKLILSRIPQNEADMLIANMSYKRLTPYSICSEDKFLQELENVRQTGYAKSNEEWAMHTFAFAVSPPYDKLERYAIVLVFPISAVDASDEGLEKLNQKVRNIIYNN